MIKRKAEKVEASREAVAAKPQEEQKSVPEQTKVVQKVYWSKSFEEEKKGLKEIIEVPKVKEQLREAFMDVLKPEEEEKTEMDETDADTVIGDIIDEDPSLR